MENIVTSVVSPKFCVPKHVHLTIPRQLVAIKDDNFGVLDDKGKFIFRVIKKLVSLHNRHVLLDAGGTPIVTFKKKTLISVHKRWQAFRGDSSRSGDLIFSVKKSSCVQLRTKLDVFLSGNGKEESWDFRVESSGLERSCVIYGKDLKPIASVQKKHTFGSIVFGKDTLDVHVYPQVDYAFVVALVVILYEINDDERTDYHLYMRSETI